MIIGLIVIFVIVIIIDYPSLLNTDKNKRMTLTYGFLMILGFAISLLQIIDKAPSSPAIIIEKIVRTIVKG